VANYTSWYQQRVNALVLAALERLGDETYHTPEDVAREAGISPGSIPYTLHSLRINHPERVIAGRRGPGGGIVLTDNEYAVRDYERANLSDLASRAETIEANLRKTVERARAPEEAARLRDTLQRMVDTINDLIPNSVP